jgi:ABC-2 type transport system permease protein
MTVRGVWTVAAVEQSKFAAQLKVRLLLAACVTGPFIFAVAMRVQSGVPSDTLFGRAVTDSGFAVPLVVLGFAALWPFPLLASVIGGDVFSAEDRYGTWTTVLSRSRSRAEVFTGKVIAAMAFSLAAVTMLAVSSVAAGVLVIGSQPLIDLSGLLLPGSQAATRVVFAWLSILAPTWGFTAMAVLLSVATRSSAAGIGLPIVIGLLMQLVAFVDGPEAARVLLLGTAFGAWHGLFADPQFIGPLVSATVVSLLYVSICLVLAYQVLVRRDIV